MTHNTQRTSPEPLAETENEVVGPYSPWPRKARPWFPTKWTDARGEAFPALSSNDLPFSG